MNGSGQEPNIGEFRIGPELNQIEYMNHDYVRPAVMSACKSEQKTDDEGKVFTEVPAASNGVVRREFGEDGPQRQNRSNGPKSKRIGLEGKGEEDNNLGPLRAFQVGEVRASSRNRNSSDVEYLDDDGGSSVCSENIYSSGDLMSLPGDTASKWSTWERNSKVRRRERDSLLEYLEKQRRESVGNRLKELQRIPNKRHSISLSSNSDMPIIAKAHPLKDATLPKQKHRASYQSVIGTPFFTKSGVSFARPLLPGGSQEMRERRDSLMNPRVMTPTDKAWGTRCFPLRETESLSGIEHFAGPPENVFSAKLFKCPLSGTKTRKSDDAVESKEPSSSSLGTRPQTEISHKRPEEASLENGCSSNYPAEGLKEVRQLGKDSFSSRNEQIHDSYRPDVAANSAVTSETERECLDKPPEVLPQGVPSSKLDSPKVSCEVYSVTESPLPVTDFRPFSDDQLRDALSTVESLDNLLNGIYSLKTDSSSDKGSDTSSTENSDKNEINSSVSLPLQKPASIETCREEKTRFMSPIRSPQTSSTPQETNSPSSLSPEREIKDNANGRFDLDNTRPSSVDHRDAANQIKAPLYPTVSRKYCSDIQIQLKEVEPVFPVNFGQSGKNSACNGEKRDDWPKERVPTPIDDDDDVEAVAPNWSSYPGSLPDDYQSEQLNDLTTTSKTTKEAKIAIEAPERSISTLEINLQSPSAGEREKVSKKKTSHTDTYDFSYDPNKSKISTVLSLRTNPKVDSKPESGFNDQRKCLIMANVIAEVDPLNTSRKSVERNEIFLVQDSSSSTAKTVTLPRDQRSRSWNQIDGQAAGRRRASGTLTRGPGTPQQEPTTRPRQQQLPGEAEALTPDDLSVKVTPSKANVTRITFYSKKDEQRTRFRDGERSWSTFEAAGGISTSGESWQASVVKRENRWKDSEMSRDSGRTPEKTPSVERIWETLEQPRTRLTKRNVRLESDSDEVIRPRTEKPHYLQRHRVASDGGTCEAKVDAAVRSNSMQDVHPDHVAGGSEGESLLEIEVQKSGLGLGFCIEGGKDGPYGDRPITVKRLFRGSSDPKFSNGAMDSLQAGDEILSANGRDITLLSRFVAWNLLKNLPEGTIKLMVRRPTQHMDSNQLH